MGQKVREAFNITGQYKFDCLGMDNGIYLVSVKNNHVFSNQKLVIAK